MTNHRVALNAILLACPVPVSDTEKRELLKAILSCEMDDDVQKLADRWLEAKEKP